MGFLLSHNKPSLPSNPRQVFCETNTEGKGLVQLITQVNYWQLGRDASWRKGQKQRYRLEVHHN